MSLASTRLSRRSWFATTVYTCAGMARTFGVFDPPAARLFEKTAWIVVLFGMAVIVPHATPRLGFAASIRMTPPATPFGPAQFPVSQRKSLVGTPGVVVM